MRTFLYLADLSVLLFNLVESSVLVPPESFGPDTALPTAGKIRLKFITVGDSGYLGSDLLDTSEAVRKLNSANNILFVALTGDLCYPAGFTSESDVRFLELISTPFSEIDVPFYPILGDNDYGSDESASSLTAYLNFRAIEPRWIMPNFYHHSVHEADDVSVCSLHIDTQSLVEVRYPETRTMEELVALDSQLPWIESTLGAALCQAADFILVFGHHPLFSASRKGNKGTTSVTLREKLLPLFDKYYIDAYFSGHDHDLQTLKKQEPKDHAISFIVSGSSSRLRKKVYDGPLDGIDSWRVVDTIGFTLTEVEKDIMTTHFVSSATGETIHSHTTRSHRHLRFPSAGP